MLLDCEQSFIRLILPGRLNYYILSMASTTNKAQK